MIGFRVGSYEIVERLGQGTSTTTWLARDHRGKRAVVKRLLDPLAADEAVVVRFLAAVDQSGKIRVRNHVATVLAEKRSSEGVFLVRQYVEGDSLARCAEKGRLSSLDPDQVARDLCDAVRAMASRDVIHGGLHPGNAIVRPDGRVKVTDFGITAAVLTSSVPESTPLEALAYLAPEQWQGAEATPRTDIYSVAAMISLVDHREPIFRVRDRRQVEQEALSTGSHVGPVLAAALHPDPARRYTAIDELRSRLGDRNSLERQTEIPKPAAQATTPAGGSLDWIFDVKERRNLLESLPPKPWIIKRDGRRQQRPLQVANRGPGNLQLSVSTVGEGVSGSPS